MDGFIDIHQHCVYGLDDGARTEDDMYGMLKKASSDGVMHIVATPHVTPGVHRFDMDLYMRHLEKGNAFCRNEGLDLALFPGCEILYTQMTPRFLGDGEIPTLAGTSCCLVEFSPDESFEAIEGAIEKLQASGFTPVIAHVERYDCLMKKARRTMKLKEENNVLFQMNCSTAISGYGFWSNLTMGKLLKEEMIDMVSSDAHSVGNRCTRMTEAAGMLRKKYDAYYVDDLMGGRAHSLLFE